MQRQVDFAGTLLSPDQAKVSAEAAGVVREVLVEIGTEVRVGAPLVQDRAAGAGAGTGPRGERAAPDTRAARDAEALTDGDKPPADEEIGSVKNALGGPRGCPRQCRASEDAGRHAG